MTTPFSEVLRVAVADDEPLVRRGLRRLLAAEPDVRLVAECASGPEVVAAVRRERPDVLFLDVQMPGKTGLEALAELGPERPRAVVFVTAFDRYAIEAFDHHAVDYLLKPFDDRRFRARSSGCGSGSAPAGGTTGSSGSSRCSRRSRSGWSGFRPVSDRGSPWCP